MNAALMVLWDPTESTGRDSLVSCTRLGNQTGSKTFQEHHFKAHSSAGCSSISGVRLFYIVLPNSSSQRVGFLRVSHLENTFLFALSLASQADNRPPGRPSRRLCGNPGRFGAGTLSPH